MNSHQQFHQNTQFGSGLTRYSSAPSSYFATLLSDDGGFGDDDFAQLFNPRASSPETQRIFSRFMNGTGSIQETCPSNMAVNSHFPASLPPRISETEDCQPPPQQQRTDYSSESQMMYANHNSEAANDSSSVERSFVSFKSYSAQPKMELPPTSSLIRHSSSPAGLFANINIEIDFKRMRGSYGDYSSSGMMEPISELGSKGMGENAADDDAQFREDNDVVDYITGLPVNAWDDSSLMSDHHLKGSADYESSGFFKANASDDQKNEAPNRPKTQLSHHLSLPKSSAELAAMEKLLQDSVPCKIRAKRGFATHPRSIAERVRRTKISERMRKLQELVPNMEKQTNTSDMLDLAVEYIKELQRQVKTLSDDQANCKCSAKQRS